MASVVAMKTDKAVNLWAATGAKRCCHKVQASMQAS